MGAAHERPERVPLAAAAPFIVTAPNHRYCCSIEPLNLIDAWRADHRYAPRRGDSIITSLWESRGSEAAREASRWFLLAQSRRREPHATANWNFNKKPRRFSGFDAFCPCRVHNFTPASRPQRREV